MSTKSGKYLIVLPLLSLLVACAQLGHIEAQNDDSRKLAQNAKTYSDHDKLANYYDDAAKKMATKAAEKKKALQHYEDKSQYYGRGGQDFQSHATANLRYYEQAAQEAQKQAHFHRKIAAELLQREYAKPAEIPDQQVNSIKTKKNSGTNNL
jgi:CHASE2 domain-containing sensor protein